MDQSNHPGRRISDGSGEQFGSSSDGRSDHQRFDHQFVADQPFVCDEFYKAAKSPFGPVDDDELGRNNPLLGFLIAVPIGLLIWLLPMAVAFLG